MHAVHNARIQLLATACNNLALAVIVAGLVAPAVSGQLHGSRSIVMLAWARSELSYLSLASLSLGGCGNDLGPGGRVADLPAVVTLGIAIAAVVASRYIP
jgi:hypothetical protein